MAPRSSRRARPDMQNDGCEKEVADAVQQSPWAKYDVLNAKY
jgi:hypothetical protein